MILDEIMVHKRYELETQQQAVSRAVLETQVAEQSPALDFPAVLVGARVRVIAEVKHASPSKGVLCPTFDPVDLAMTYAENGVAAISVLTDERFFQGSLDDLSKIKRALREARLTIPILRKDFIFDPYQVVETRVAGADALLLIVAVLSDAQLAALLALTHALGMTALVEVHDEAEMKRALSLHPRVIGINNRNLRDFTVNPTRFERLHALLPNDVIAVAESGIHTAVDVHLLAAMGADAVLVGEALVTAPDVAAVVQDLVTGRLP